MNLAEYAKDSEQAIAKEIFNAKFNSVEDVMALKAKINKEKRKLDKEISNFNNIIRSSICCRENIAKLKKQLKMCYTDNDAKKIEAWLEIDEKALKNYKLKRDALFEEYDVLTLIALSKNFRKSYNLKFIKSKYAL